MSEFSEHYKRTYEIYCHGVGETTDGKPLPTWEELGDRQKRGWSRVFLNLTGQVYRDISDGVLDNYKRLLKGQQELDAQES